MEKLRYLPVRELTVWSGNGPYFQAGGGCSKDLQPRETFGGLQGIAEAPGRITSAGEWSGVTREGDQYWQENNFF
jgi:hypothetical protein